MFFSLKVSAFRPGLVTRQCRNIKAPFGLVISSTTPFSATSSTVDLHASTAPLQLTATYECLFDIQVPEGRCVGLTLPDLPDDHPDALVGDRILESSGSSSSSSTNNGSHYYNHEEPHQRHWIYSHLHADEIRYGLQLSRPTQASFWMGRLALRKALSSTSSPCTAVSTRSILKDSHGRPELPPGFLGSISHKGRTGVALVAPAPAPSGDYSLSTLSSTAVHRPCLGIGVDIEESKPKRRSIARKVLTPNEQKNLGQLPDVSLEEEVLLRFSLKESIYKAMHPLICQYVGFMEAEVQPLPDGTATTTFMLKSGVHHQFETVTAHWQRIGDYFLTTSSVRLRNNATKIPISGRDECEL